MSVNPYSLFGLSSKSTLTELRKSYYELSLFCHPDKGGSSTEMDVVHKAYLYIKEQLDNCRVEKSYEMLEEEFENFCKQQTQKPPCFREIYDNYNDFAREFNRQFTEMNKDTSSTDSLPNPFQFGYSDFMEDSNNESVEYPQNDHNKPITNEFEMRLITYQEPHLLPDSYGEHLQLNEEKINDFSHKINKLELTDYVKAFSVKNIDKEYEIVEDLKKTYDDMIDERKKLDNQLANKEDTNTPLLDNFTTKRNNAASIIQNKYRKFIKIKKRKKML